MKISLLPKVVIEIVSRGTVLEGERKRLLLLTILALDIESLQGIAVEEDGGVLTFAQLG